jgi:DNA (cytosine-5)-methyltransferase 1
MRIGSLFTGYGGLDMAVMELLGGSLAWYSEIDRAARIVLEAHYPEAPNLGDVTGIDWANVEPVDVLTGGYPCQPFSHAGNRKGSKDARHLYPYVSAAISRLRPNLVVLENVDGHRTLGLADVLLDLAGLGYDARWGVVRASDAGAPHGRARVFIVASPSDSIGERHDGVGDIRSESGSGGGRPNAARPSGITADADRGGHGQQKDAGGVDSVESAHAEQAREWERARPVPDTGSTWGKYETAVRRWERITRPAPEPTIGGRLNPAFSEWMMGIPEGWVTGHGLKPSQELKLCGNGVVPRQALMALTLLGVTS